MYVYVYTTDIAHTIVLFKQSIEYFLVYSFWYTEFHVSCRLVVVILEVVVALTVVVLDI